MSAVATAIAGSAVVGGYMQAEGAKAAGKAAGKAANAQAAESQRQFNITQENIDKALEMANSPQELRILQSSLDQQQKAVAQQTKLFQALDPAILEASKQALNLLQGKESSVLNPIRNQRDRQRTKLLNRLRETLGPGAENSTAGIQALTQFDTQTDEMLYGAQQQQLGNLFSMGQSGAANRGALNQSIGNVANIGQAFGNIAARRANAQLGGTSTLAQVGQGMVQSAGSQFIAQQLQGQQQAQLGSSLVNAGTTLGSAYLTKGK